MVDIMVMSEKNDDEKSVTYTALSAIEFVRKTTVSLSLSLSLSLIHPNSCHILRAMRDDGRLSEK